MCVSRPWGGVLFKLEQQCVFAHRFTCYSCLCSEEQGMERKCTFFRKTNERCGIQASPLHELQGCEDRGCLLSLRLLISTVVNSAGSNLFMLSCNNQVQSCLFSLVSATLGLCKLKSPLLSSYIVVPLTQNHGYLFQFFLREGTGEYGHLYSATCQSLGHDFQEPEFVTLQKTMQLQNLHTKLPKVTICEKLYRSNKGK